MNSARNNFFPPGAPELLKISGFESFDGLWQADCDWIETGKPTDSYHKATAEYGLDRENGEHHTIIIKREETPSGRIWSEKPPLRNEWRNLKKLIRCKIAVPEPLYFGEQRQHGCTRTILVTYKLHDYLPLNQCLKELAADCDAGQNLRLTAGPIIAGIIRRFHDCRFRHHQLFPENIMLKVRRNGTSAVSDIKLAGLEKVRRVFSPLRARISDLETLLSHCPAWTIHEKNLFLGHYLELKLNHLPPKQLAEELWKIPLVKWVKRRVAAL